jgi:acyl-CoA synthetase (NDP forming)
MMHPQLGRLLAPRSLAIIGANDKGNVGARALKTALALGFSGPVYPINPNYETLQGRRCYPSLTALPEIPDAAVVSVPIGGALAVVADAAKAAIPALILFSEGFADAGTAAGHERNAALLRLAADSGMALCGPNCAGIFSLARNYAATFTNLPEGLRRGGISILSQSGGLINALLELGRNRGLGVNYVISAGNEAVVNSADYLDWLADDADTEVIIALIEGVKDGARLREALAGATARKPVLILKLGRSAAGGLATLAHTGSLAGRDDAFRALCAQSGAILCDTVDALLETAAMLLGLALPRGDRLVLFSTSGGATVLSTDLGTAAGLRFPPLAPATNAALQAILEVERPFTNPFDVVGNPRLVKGNNMERCLDTLLADDSVDLVGCVLVLPRDASAQRQKLLDQVKVAAGRSDKPVVLLPEMTMHWRETPPDAGTHVAASLQDGLVGLRNLIAYAQHRRQARIAAARKPAPPLPLPRPPGRKVLTEHHSKQILAAAGLPVTREELVQSPEAAVAAARRIGGPVALKLQSPDLMHKTEAGGVLLGLTDESAIRAGYQSLTARHAGLAACDGVLVQEMIADGVEIMLGMVRDPALGPLIVLSPGGVFVALFERAAAVRLPPFDHAEAERMVEECAAVTRLLQGFRGRPPADRAALVALIVDFAAFTERLDPSVAAIDLNPVMVLPAGRGTVIVDAAIEFAAIR